MYSVMQMTRHSDEVLSEDLRRLHVWMAEQEQVGIYTSTHFDTYSIFRVHLPILSAARRTSLSE